MKLNEAYLFILNLFILHWRNKNHSLKLAVIYMLAHAARKLS